MKERGREKGRERGKERGGEMGVRESERWREERKGERDMLTGLVFYSALTPPFSTLTYSSRISHISARAVGRSWTMW